MVEINLKNIIQKQSDIALLVLRFITVGIFSYHVLERVFSFELAQSTMANFGFPAFIGVPLVWIEFIGGILILGGLFSRTSGAILSSIMLFTVIFIYLPQGYSPLVERNLLLATSFFMMAIFGPGKYSLEKVLEKQKKK